MVAPCYLDKDKQKLPNWMPQFSLPTEFITIATTHSYLELESSENTSFPSYTWKQHLNCSSMMLFWLQCICVLKVSFLYNLLHISFYCRRREDGRHYISVCDVGNCDSLVWLENVTAILKLLYLGKKTFCFFCFFCLSFYKKCLRKIQKGFT